MSLFGKRKSRIKVCVFGSPSSGKTTLFTGLWQISDQDSFPDNVNVDFRSMKEGLRNGHPIKGNQPGQISNLRFLLAAEPHLAIEVEDYAGEYAKEFLESESGEAKQMLLRCDAILLLLDSFRLCRVSSFKKWADDIKLDTLFRCIDEVCSDKHQDGIPFIVACTRSDLVSSDRLNLIINEIRAYADGYRVTPEIRSITVFGKHKAPDEMPPSDADMPPQDFLVPEEAIKPEPIESLFRALYQMHAKRLRPNILGRVLAIVALSGILLAGVFEYIRSQRLTIDDVTQLFANVSDSNGSLETIFSAVNFRDHAFALQAAYEHYSQQFQGNPEALEALDDAYAEALRRFQDTEMPKLTRFDVERRRWIPQEVVAYIDAYTKHFRDREEDLPLEKIYSRKKIILDETLKKIGANNIEHLSALAKAYGDIGQRLPEALVGRIQSIGGRDYFVRRVAERLRSSSDYQSMYYCAQNGIPSIRQEMNAYWEHLDPGFKREYEALVNYLELVRSTKEIKVKGLTYYKDDEEISTVDLKILPGWSEDDDNRIWRVKWSIDSQKPIRISAEAGYGLWRRRLTRKKFNWDSRDMNHYSGAFNKAGMVLPHLDFLVFLDARENGRTYRDSTFTLRYGSIEPEGLFNVPKLLIDANKN